MARQNYRISDLIYLQLPCTLYFILFISLASVLMGFSGAGSMMILGSGLAVRSLLDYANWQNLTKQSEGKALFELALIILIQCISLNVLINLMLPNIAGFSFIRGQDLMNH